jgi:hypothetical protein
MASLQIPTYQKTELPPDKGPNVLINPDAFNAGDKGMERLGSDISQGSGEVYEAMKRYDDRRATAQGAHNVYEYEANLAKVVEGLKEKITGNDVHDVSKFTGDNEDKGKDFTYLVKKTADKLAEQRGSTLEGKALELFNNERLNIAKNMLQHAATYQAAELRHYEVQTNELALNSAYSNIKEGADPNTEIARYAENVGKVLPPGSNKDAVIALGISQIREHAEATIEENKISTATIQFEREAKIKFHDPNGDSVKELADYTSWLSGPDGREYMIKQGITKANTQDNIIRNLENNEVHQNKAYTIASNRIAQDVNSKILSGKIKSEKDIDAILGERDEHGRPVLTITDQNMIRNSIHKTIQEERINAAYIRKMSLEGDVAVRQKLNLEYDLLNKQKEIHALQVKKTFGDQLLKGHDFDSMQILKLSDGDADLFKHLNELNTFYKKAKETDGDDANDPNNIKGAAHLAVDSGNAVVFLTERTKKYEDGGMNHPEALQKARADLATGITVKALDGIKSGGTPKATPKSEATPAKTVVNTGMYKGKKVIKYSDGTVEYAR